MGFSELALLRYQVLNLDQCQMYQGINAPSIPVILSESHTEKEYCPVAVNVTTQHMRDGIEIDESKSKPT